MAQSNDMLGAHIVRHRFFRILVIASLLLLGVAALQIPFGGADGDAGQGAPRVASQSVQGGAAVPENANSANKPPAESPNEATSPEVSAKVQPPPPESEKVVVAPNGSSQKASDSEIARDIRFQNFVFHIASDAGRQIANASQASLPLPKLPGDEWFWGSRPSFVPPSATKRSADPKPAAVSKASPEPSRVAATKPKPRGGKALPARVVLVNPRETGTTLRFLVNGKVHALAAGDRFELRGDEEGWAIQFHRGGELDDVRYHLTDGAFLFGASQGGWELVKAKHVRE